MSLQDAPTSRVGQATDLEFAFGYFIVQVGNDELRTRALVASRADGGATSLTSRAGRFLRLAEPVVLPAATFRALSKVGVRVSIVPCDRGRTPTGRGAC